MVIWWISWIEFFLDGWWVEILAKDGRRWEIFSSLFVVVVVVFAGILYVFWTSSNGLSIFEVFDDITNWFLFYKKIFSLVFLIECWIVEQFPWEQLMIHFSFRLTIILVNHWTSFLHFSFHQEKKQKKDIQWNIFFFFPFLFNELLQIE